MESIWLPAARGQHSRALERRVAEVGNYAARPHMGCPLRRVLARRQVSGFWQRRQKSQALELRIAEGGNYAARPQLICQLRCILARW